MFKFFESWLPIRDSHPSIEKLAEVERDKRKCLTNAKQFATKLTADMHTLRQFFDIEPKIGRFGNTVKDENTVVLTMDENFFKGVKITFYINDSGVAGFEFSTTD